MADTTFYGEWEYMNSVNKNEGPSPRCGHTMTVHGNTPTAKINKSNNKQKHKLSKLLVSFGESSLLQNRKYYQDMYLFDLETSKWVKILGKNIKNQYKPYIQSNFNPIARADHASTAFGKSYDRAVLFGGKCQDTYLDDLIIVKNINKFPMNGVPELDASEYNNRHHSRSSHITSEKRICIEPIHLSKGPCGRRGSSLTFWKEGSFLLFGGQRGSLFFNDLWGLDLYKQGWVELSTKKNPCPRAFHSAFVDAQQKLLVLGGVCDTQANPTSDDIYKLDLRAGRFVKLGDKNLVPGLSVALSKGHHTSHFLNEHSDLVIYAPQRPSCHVLGGNTHSKHCGVCCPITSTVNAPPGACRPATALYPASKALHDSMSFRNCDTLNQHAAERLFVFGGYVPMKKCSTNDMLSFKFSTKPCSLSHQTGHLCSFSKTHQFSNKATNSNQQNNPIATNQNNNSNNNNNESQDQPKFTDFQFEQQSNNNSGKEHSVEHVNKKNFMNSNIVTPMRHGKTMKRFTTNAYDIASSIESNKENSNSNSNSSSKLRDSQLSVSITRTPVRSKADPNLSFNFMESTVSRQKISQLDASLRDLSSHSRESVSNDHNTFITTILLNYKPEMLSPDAPFEFDASQVISLIDACLEIFQKEATLVRFEAPVKVFGDLHGQLGDLMALFKAFGYPDAVCGDLQYYKYAFLGDFVDRGHKSLEIMCLLLALKIKYPDRIFLTRGNHECHAMNELYGFHDEIIHRLKPVASHNGKVFKDEDTCLQYVMSAFEELFQWLPLALVISGKILCVHGGIGKIDTIKEIEDLQRPCDVICDIEQEMTSEEARVVDLLWSDPAECDEECGFQPNKRGVSCLFGSDVVNRFCENNDIDLIIRGHQVVKDGYEYFAQGHLITLFSATNYCDIMDNAGAILCIDASLRVIAKLVEPKAIPNMSSISECQDLGGDDSTCQNGEEENNNKNENVHNWRSIPNYPPSPMRETHSRKGDDAKEEERCLTFK